MRFVHFLQHTFFVQLCHDDIPYLTRSQNTGHAVLPRGSRILPYSIGTQATTNWGLLYTE